MTSVLPNGTVLPHGLLGVSQDAAFQAYRNTFDNKALKAGVVVKSYDVKDPENLTGLIPDYDVQVIEQSGAGAPAIRTYKHCVSAQGLGSVADYFEFTLRERTKVDKDTEGYSYENHDGALVLLLCLDGNEEKAVIIGALRNPDRKTKLTEDNILSGAFNGASIDIKKDGSIKAQFVGATKNDGTPEDESLGPTAIDIEKDGSFKVSHKNASVYMKKEGQIETVSEKSQTSTSNKGDITFEAKEENISFSAKKDLSAKAKNAIFEIQDTVSSNSQTFKVLAQNEVSIQSGSSTFIKASSSVIVQAPSIVADGICLLGGGGGVPALTMNTITYGIGALGVPVISRPIAGFATRVFAR